MNIFSVDSKIYGWMNRFCQLVLLNILWILCSLPIITIGASTTALYYTSFQMMQYEDTPVTKTFFYAFRKNFFCATIIFIICIAVSILIFSDFIICNRFFSHSSSGLLLLPLLAVAFLFCLIACYLYPLTACFQDGLSKTFWHALCLAGSHLPSTFVLCFLSAGPVLLFRLFSAKPVFASFLCLILGVSLFIWLKSMILFQIFKPYLHTADLCTKQEDQLI